MLVSILFPLADVRRFVAGRTDRLTAPDWGEPTPDIEFIRSFGALRARPRGPLPGFVGEGVVCDARRAIQMESVASPKLKLPYRRYFFDNWACAKLSVGIARSGLPVREPSHLGAEELNTILLTPFRVVGADRAAPLVDCGELIARAALNSTTKVRTRGKSAASWWISEGQPLVVVEGVSGTGVSLDALALGPTKVKQGTDIWSFDGATVQFGWVECGGNPVQVWSVSGGAVPGHEARARARALRLILERYHAEAECLIAVVALIARRRLTPDENTIEGALLVKYLARATKRLAAWSQSDGSPFSAEDHHRVVTEAYQHVHRGFPAALSEALERLQHFGARDTLRRAVVRRLGSQDAEPSAGVLQDAVASVHAKEGGDAPVGTAFVARAGDTPRVFTCAHVLRRWRYQVGDKVSLRFSHRVDPVQAKWLGSGPLSDLPPERQSAGEDIAVLEVDSSTVALDWAEPTAGSEARVFGFGHTRGQRGGWVGLTLGDVVALGFREAHHHADAPYRIEQGHSGAAVLVEGRVVGMIQSTLDRTVYFIPAVALQTAAKKHT